MQIDANKVEWATSRLLDPQDPVPPNPGDSYPGVGVKRSDTMRVLVQIAVTYKTHGGAQGRPQGAAASVYVMPGQVGHGLEVTRWVAYEPAALEGEALEWVHSALGKADADTRFRPRHRIRLGMFRAGPVDLHNRAAWADLYQVVGQHVDWARRSAQFDRHKRQHAVIAIVDIADPRAVVPANTNYASYGLYEIVGVHFVRSCVLGTRPDVLDSQSESDSDVPGSRL